MRIWYLVIALVVLGLIIWAVIFFAQKKKDKAQVESSSNNLMLKFPAKRGDRGPHIMEIQAWANTKLNPPLQQLEVDGIWGGLTDTAINYITGKTIVTYPEYQKMV